MNLLTYLKRLPHGTRRAFADSVGTSLGHLNNCAYGIKRVGPALAMAIEKRTNGAVMRSELRDDAHLIWSDVPKPRRRK
jgi:DNA-binding transcriptional regulator YdaS (Cro superfamily)